MRIMKTLKTVLSVTIAIMIVLFAGIAQAAAQTVTAASTQEKAPKENIISNTTAKIDATYMNRGGYVKISYLKQTTKTVKVLIKTPKSNTYTYKLNRFSGEVFPLSEGNGTYTVGVYTQIEGTKYSSSLSATLSVTLEDPNAPFLAANQYVNYVDRGDSVSKTVSKAKELVAGLKNPTEYDIVKVIYDYVTLNFKYDKTKASQIKSGTLKDYLPNVDEILNSKKGICFDYSSVMTAMLRSQGIACKLVVGYAGKDRQYHAWINVYDSTKGQWLEGVVIYNGKEWKLMDPTAISSNRDASGNVPQWLKDQIGNDAMYEVKYIY